MDLLDHLAALDHQPHATTRLTDLEARALTYMIRGLTEQGSPVLPMWLARARAYGLDPHTLEARTSQDR